MLRGMVMPMLVFPLNLLSSFVITLTPEISRMNAAGNSRRLVRTVEAILRYTCAMGILIVAVFMTFPGEIGLAVYKNAEVGDMLRMLSFLCPFMCVEMVSVGILNGLGEQVSSMKYALLDSVTRIALIYFLIPVRGVTGFMIMVAVSNVLTSVLNFRRMTKLVPVRLRLLSWVGGPAIAAAAVGQGVRLLYTYSGMADWGRWIGLAIGICVIAAAYAALLLLMGNIKSEDFYWIIDRIKTSTKTPQTQPEKIV
jgi:stage V sporulation protein B